MPLVLDKIILIVYGSSTLQIKKEKHYARKNYETN